MNALNLRQPATISEEVDAFIINQLDAIAVNAEIGSRCAEIGDPAGLDHALRQLSARLKSVVGIVNDLRVRKHSEVQDAR